MEVQEIINVLFAIIFFLLGWFVKITWGALSELKKEDALVKAEVNKLSVIVAGDYAKREEVSKLADALFKKLDRIEDKLDAKADKQ